jgi:predicted DCC family thiol-disulfide oxidoreductase YuxK
MSARIQAMWVLYDDGCGFCCRCADWLRAQDKLVPLMCLPRSGEVAQRAFAKLPQGNDELVVVDSEGGVYRGGDAFLMALWALEAFRPWAAKAGREPLRSRARNLFHWISTRRQDISATLNLVPEARLVAEVDRAARDASAMRCAS